MRGASIRLCTGHTQWQPKRGPAAPFGFSALPSLHLRRLLHRGLGAARLLTFHQQPRRNDHHNRNDDVPHHIVLLFNTPSFIIYPSQNRQDILVPLLSGDKKATAQMRWLF